MALANLIICGIVIRLGLHAVTGERADVFFRIGRSVDGCHVIHFRR